MLFKRLTEQHTTLNVVVDNVKNTLEIAGKGLVAKNVNRLEQRNAGIKHDSELTAEVGKLVKSNLAGTKSPECRGCITGIKLTGGQVKTLLCKLLGQISFIFCYECTLDLFIIKVYGCIFILLQGTNAPFLFLKTKLESESDKS